MFGEQWRAENFYSRFPSEKIYLFFEATTDYLKTFSKFMKEDEDFIR